MVLRKMRGGFDTYIPKYLLGLAAEKQLRDDRHQCKVVKRGSKGKKRVIINTFFGNALNSNNDC
ncbi:MAG: hypothetical protein EAZ78_19445 [Oscillatoriales cyanobacterium]|nr:MAG: hypothetical protein EA000_17040 [Oscillatoriales cyanobacterium]TAD95624.1 MAG: hypothetical protein EAZ98_15130 [Oscillatoriales cyanobacterium]TAE01916.1 MAG: hypothetical protein EAZ96_17570 [Oscillatoriales cyanobacterium]TAF00904.1 MAG: hypothetical protein EAZ78_19445 [Oscillatoriales cyanobacterium]TAF44180.1 MAG: hypothetical protein EAZ68_06750 [Oscillatoriales cyanobacterium]